MTIFYITKYALTDGVLAIECEGPSGRDGNYINGTLVSGGGRVSAYGEGRSWHRTPEAAIARAEEMRKAKIASLKKQIAKLEAMVFEVKS